MYYHLITIPPCFQKRIHWWKSCIRWLSETGNNVFFKNL